MSIQSKVNQIKVIKNEEVAKDIFLMELEASIDAKAGQFINIKLANHYLRRPISIAKIKENSFEILYKIIGEGTKDLSKVNVNDYLDILYPLGNGFDLVEGKKVLLVGGGIGTFPLLQLYDELITNNDVTLLVGLNNISENIYDDYHPIITTMDDSGENQGNVIDYLNNNDLEYDYVYTCGPIKMMSALSKYVKCDGQVSIESRMGCGFGACMGCSCKTKNNESKRICVEGPVFKIGELNLDEY